MLKFRKELEYSMENNNDNLHNNQNPTARHSLLPPQTSNPFPHLPEYQYLFSFLFFLSTRLRWSQWYLGNTYFQSGRPAHDQVTTITAITIITFDCFNCYCSRDNVKSEVFGSNIAPPTMSLADFGDAQKQDAEERAQRQAESEGKGRRYVLYAMLWYIIILS